jgi:hypothetical protein
MTFDECQDVLTRIRRKQGTRCPVIRVDYGGSVFKGRLVRCDSDPTACWCSRTPACRDAPR